MRIKFQHRFVNTKPAMKMSAMLDTLDLNHGGPDGRFIALYSEAGRGKSESVLHWHGIHGGVYLYIHTAWRNDTGAFYSALLGELGVQDPPKRHADRYGLIIETLRREPRILFLDEVDKLTLRFLDIFKDIADVTQSPIVLTGEENLPAFLRQNRRIWTRTLSRMEMDPVERADIMLFAQTTTGLTLSPDVAGLLLQAADGDSTPGSLRVVKQAVLNLVDICNAKSTTDVSEEMARIAVSRTFARKNRRTAHAAR